MKYTGANMKKNKFPLIISLLTTLLIITTSVNAAKTFLKPFYIAENENVFVFQIDATPNGDTFISGAVTSDHLIIGSDSYDISGYFLAKVGRHGGVEWVKSIDEITELTFLFDPKNPKKCELAVGNSNVVVALQHTLLIMDFDGNSLALKNLSGTLSSGGLSIHKENSQIVVISQMDNNQLMVTKYSINDNSVEQVWNKNISLVGIGDFSAHGTAIDDMGDVYLTTQIDNLIVTPAQDVWIEVDGRNGYSSKDAFVVSSNSFNKIKDLKGMFNGSRMLIFDPGVFSDPSLLYNEPLDLKEVAQIIDGRITGISLAYMNYTMEFWSKGLVTIYYGGKGVDGDMEFEIGEERDLVEFEQEKDDGEGEVQYELKDATALHHWAASYDGLHIKMYCDGVLINQLKADPIKVDTDRREFRINGTIDEFRIWTVERKAEEIRNYRNKRVTGEEGDLLVCYRPLSKKVIPQTVLMRLDNTDGNVVTSRALSWDDAETSGICHSGGLLYLAQQSKSDAILRSYNTLLSPKKSMYIAGDNDTNNSSDSFSDFIPGFISMKPDIEGNILVMGSTSKGTTAFYDASSPPGNSGSIPFTERNSSNKGFFVGRWNGSLDCDWIQFSNASTSASIQSEYGFGDLIQDPKDSDWIFFMGSFSNGSLSFGSTGESNVIYSQGQTDAFMCGIRPDGNFLKEVTLEIVSEPDEIAEIEHEVIPKLGKATYLEGTSFEASVPKMLKQDATIEGQLYTDVVRYVCTGFNVEGTITGGTENSYVFTLIEDMRLIFNWQKKIAVIVESKFENSSSPSEAFGNPDPAVGRHYYNDQDRVILQIDGIVKSYENTGTRHVVTKYAQNGLLNEIDEPVEDRFQVPQFIVSEPTLVQFNWARQYRIQVSTSGSSTSSLPAICSLDNYGKLLKYETGIGEFWFDSGKHVQIMAKEHEGLIAVSGWFNGTGSIPSEGSLDDLNTRLFNQMPYRYIDILSLNSKITLTWNYGDRIFRETVNIGDPIRFVNVPQDIRLQRSMDESPANATLIDSPPDSTLSNMYLFSEYELNLYPLRPGKFLLEWNMDNTDERMITEITSIWPQNTNYLHVANTPPVLIDVSNTDERHYKSLIYTESEATISLEKTFTCFKRGNSLIYYTQKHYTNTEPLEIWLSMDGIDDYIDLGSEIQLDNTPFSIEFWARRSSINNESYIITQNAENNGLKLGFKENNTFSFSFSEMDLNTHIQYTDAAWHHYAVVFEPEGYTRYIYVDSNLIDFEAYENTPYSHTGNVFVAKSEDAYFHGDIDEIRIFNTIRTQEEIAASMNQCLTINEKGLLAYFSLDRNLSSDFVKDKTEKLPLAKLNNINIETAWQFNDDFIKEPATGDETSENVILKSVKTSLWNDNLILSQVAIAHDIESQYHEAEVPHNGYVFWDKARYNVRAYNRETMIGPIFAVNTQYNTTPEDDLVIIWYQVKDKINWPWQPEHFTAYWPETDNRIVIASRFGSEGKDSNGKEQTVFYPNRYRNLILYNQPDPDQAGYNPNEEHAGIYTSFKYVAEANPPRAAFALRNNLNITSQDENFTSLPYVLVQYTDTRINKIEMDLYKIDVQDESMGYIFQYPMKAGEPVFGPYPLNEVIGANPPLEIYGEDGEPEKQIAYWEDHKGTPWCISGNTYLFSYFYYPLDPSFWHPEKQQGETICFSMTDGQSPQQVRYDTSWPTQTPILKVGETLTFAGGEYRADYPNVPGLPGVVGWASGQILFDTLNPLMDSSLFFTMYQVRLAQMLEKISVDFNLSHMPESLKPASGNTVSGDKWFFNELHAGLKPRLYYDYIMNKLCFQGLLNDKTIGDNTLTAAPPSIYILQPNILTSREKEDILSLPGINNAFRQSIETLYNLSRDPDSFNKNYTVGITKTQTVDSESGNITEIIAQTSSPGPGLAVFCNPYLVGPTSPYTQGYVVLAENNLSSLGDLPVALHIIKIDKDETYRGSIKVVESDNVFDEKITLRHTADFGANPDDLIFEWWYREEDGVDQLPPGMAESGVWSLFPDNSGNNGMGMNEICMAGTGKILLVDNLFFVRYRHKGSPNNIESWSTWAGAANNYPHLGVYQPQLAYGWVKRVITGINPFEARINEFSGDAPATYVSMIQQAGRRYEGDVAFNPDKDVIENVGLIELYQTVLNRAKDLSIDLSQPASSSGVTAALLLAVNRIADFYLLLGNEAYQDALNPTIGIGADHLEYGYLAPSIFAFMNQVPDLLEEELILLRGRDEYGAAPVYNRFLWNFTKSHGEAAYVMTYHIPDYNLDGFIDEKDGRTFYPQGHGDAWGYYLTALKSYYDLLTHDIFNYEARSEKFHIEGVVIDVDYLDERKFAQAAGSRAKVGTDLVKLTYRSRYVEDPDGQWQGYKDTDPDRSWGVHGWGMRSGMAVYFDTMIANALLPAEDNNPSHTGIRKVERKLVKELAEITAQGRSIQQEIDNASSGVNPLGIAHETVPFDIDPKQFNTLNHQTHFEQMANRAEKALQNTLTIFNYMNSIESQIRRIGHAEDDFIGQVEEMDLDFRHRLIEIFGSPYEGTIGSGKAYAAGYQGPDIYYYNYIDLNEISNANIPAPSDSVTAIFEPGNVIYTKDNTLSLGFSDIDLVYAHFLPQDFSNGYFETWNNAEFREGIIEIEYPLTAADYSFVAPKDWEIRRSPGKIQQELIKLVQTQADLELAIAEYAGVLGEIYDNILELKARTELFTQTIDIGNELYAYIEKVNNKIIGLNEQISIFTGIIDYIEDVKDAMIDGLPTIVGLSNDPSSAARSALDLAVLVTKIVSTHKINELGTEISVIESDRELAEMDSSTFMDMAQFRSDVQNILINIDRAVGPEPAARLNILKQREVLREQSEIVRTTIAEGIRLLEERSAFNTGVSSKVQTMRYEDMALRLTQNKAVSEYRTAFDMAANYIYLAAKTYDYETNLSHNHPCSAIPLLTEIVRQRTLGQFEDDKTVLGGGGLADILLKLRMNYDSLKSRMGISNTQNESGHFSLRKELFRIKDGNDKIWRDTLDRYKVEDLWKVPEYRRFCRPVAPESAGPQPGLMISFQSAIKYGQNFFGWPLGSGDHAYDASNYATKVLSVGLWFENYDNTLLSETPRAYLVPAGMDIMYVPDSVELASRQWHVIDQSIPVPMPVNQSNLQNPSWIAGINSVNIPGYSIRKYSSFRAYHDNGYFNENEMVFDTRLVGRSVWNSRWLLIIPGSTFLADPDEGLDSFIHGKEIPGLEERDQNGVKDIKMFFQTYAIAGD